MKVIETELAGVLVIEPQVFEDSRGSFFEAYQHSRYSDAGIGAPFVQDNVVKSERHVLRGLHLQNPYGQGKLVQALGGEIFDVAVDVRLDSPTFRQWTSVTLSDTNHRQIFVPPEFAHGYVVLSDGALVSYKTTDVYTPEAELAVVWNDPEIGIDWPVADPVLNERDATAPLLSEIPMSRLPQYAG
jgi:dTDP-4-dehydrorhamnose 3,5-epimerase